MDNTLSVTFRTLNLSYICRITRNPCEKNIACTECKVSSKFNLCDSFELFHMTMQSNKAHTIGKIGAHQIDIFLINWHLKEYNTSDINEMIDKNYPAWNEFRNAYGLFGCFSYYYHEEHPLIIVHNHKDAYIIAPQIEEVDP